MQRRALVSGGAGFIGSHVADLLLENDYAVTVLDNLSSGKRAQVPSAAAFKELDICSPEAAATVREGKFDVICHLAAQIDVRKSVADPAADAQLNIGGSLNLLEAVRQSGHATRFVFSSTGGAVYGDLVEAPTSENAPKDPQSPYGTAKFSVELYMGYFARVHGLDCVALRYANVYGPRQDPHGEAGVVAIFCDRLIDGTPLTIFGDGGQTRDYVHVGDVARANLAGATVKLPPAAGVDSRAFNIGTSIETDVVMLANVLKDVSSG
ncbi:MAG: NAD-dependent epimerase/dehydratase family protein, partial [Gemmatimonadaceae bacterium]|nr:NAD-dependent epimerase/dehydratase family protein [Gemmatimonadaceae bacterium]